MAPTDDRPPETGVDGSALADRLDAVIGALDRLRDRPVASTLVALTLAALGALAWSLGQPGPVVPVEARIPYATTSAADVATTRTSVQGPSADQDEATELLVHVAGAVERPGIVTLEPGARIGDAVTAAGGPTSDADVHQLNLAAPVVDGLQVRVPVAGEVVPPGGMPPQTETGGGTGPGAVSIVDVNSATEVELEALPGIGPALASAIVEWRARNGPFSTPDDLLDVPGIGPAKLDGLVDHIVL